MEQRCTCGALLPPDARFCHKCGAPQYAEDIERMAAVEAQPLAPPAATLPVSVVSAPDNGVGNLRAVGITMIAAALAFVGLLLFGMILPPAVPLILSAAGFAATRFYSSKRAVSALSGALLGSMTGGWLFLLFAVIIGIFSISLSTPQGQEMLKGMPPNMAQIYRPLEDPHQVFIFLVVAFFALILSSTFGGLLAARLGRPSR